MKKIYNIIFMIIFILCSTSKVECSKSYQDTMSYAIMGLAVTTATLAWLSFELYQELKIINTAINDCLLKLIQKKKIASIVNKEK